MADEVLVCREGEIADGDVRLIKVGPVEIGVIHHKGSYYAYRNLCPHQGGPVCEGLKLPQVVEGEALGEIIDALVTEHQAELLAAEGASQ